MAEPEQEPVHTDQEYTDELNYLLTIVKHPRTTQVLQNALSAVEQPLEESRPAPDATKQGTTTTEQTVTVQPISTSTQPRETLTYPTTKISQYGWDQSEKYVKIYISSIAGLEELNKESVSSEFQQRSMKVNMFRVKGKNYGLVISDLFSPIVPEQSSVKVKNGMVIVSLRKSSTKQWTYLTAREKRLKDAREMKPPKMDKDAEDPGMGLMNIMKQMYNEGDDEMKRTISKAWHESQEKRAREGDL